MKLLKTTILLAFLSAITLNLPAQMKFEEGSWSEVKAQAAKENKFIFVDAYTTWCGPCKWMAKNVFPDEKVGKFYNKNFVNYKLDMEKGEGLEFAKNHKVRSYPSYLFFDSKGELVHRTGSSKEAADFIADGKAAIDPDQQLMSLMKRFENGEKSSEFLYSYAHTLFGANMNTSEVADLYLDSQKKSDWTSEKNWTFIKKMISSSDPDVFGYVASHRNKFEKVAGGAAKVDQYLFWVLKNEIRTVARKAKEKDLKQLKKKFDQLMPEEAAMLAASADYNFYTRDKEKAEKYANIYFDNHCQDWGELNSIAWKYFEKYEDETHLNKAMSWIEKSISLDKNWYNTDSKANILLKLGRAEEALKAAEEAIEIGNAAGEDTQETEELLRDIHSEM